jgi:hypothetical protein
MERMVDKKTKLVEISLVAMNNGFQHDLKAVCDLAHAHGAYVYADIAQAAGCTPIDVRPSDVDFCACSSFKWLMGDFGLGFLFVKESLLDRVVHRSQYGYFQAASLESHYLPGNPPGPAPYTWELGKDASAYCEVGTHAIGVSHALSQSLPYIRGLGVENRYSALRLCSFAPSRRVGLTRVGFCIVRKRKILAFRLLREFSSSPPVVKRDSCADEEHHDDRNQHRRRPARGGPWSSCSRCRRETGSLRSRAGRRDGYNLVRDRCANRLSGCRRGGGGCCRFRWSS